MRKLFVLLFVCLATPLWAERPPFVGQIQKNGSPRLTFSESAISAAGLPPHALATVTGFVMDTHDFTREITTPEYDAQADAAGAISVAVPAGVKPRSVWILVTRTGYTVASPGGGVLRQFDIPAENIQLSSGNHLTLVIPRAHTEVFRIPQVPSAGNSEAVVSIDAKDGAPNDTDQEINGTTSVSLTAKPGDTIFVVDFSTLEFFSTTVQQ